jgi:hypothetical protein
MLSCCHTRCCLTHSYHSLASLIHSLTHPLITHSFTPRSMLSTRYSLRRGTRLLRPFRSCSSATPSHTHKEGPRYFTGMSEEPLEVEVRHSLTHSLTHFSLALTHIDSLTIAHTHYHTVDAQSTTAFTH